MYDILQLNDMLVPELLDIAEQQNITNAKTLEKQELIYKILDKQALMNNTEKKSPDPEKPKRKRIIKTIAEPAPVAVLPVAEPIEDVKPKKSEEKKKHVKKVKEEEEPEVDLDTQPMGKMREELTDPKLIAPGLVDLLNDDEEDEDIQESLSNNYQN